MRDAILIFVTATVLLLAAGAAAAADGKTAENVNKTSIETFLSQKDILLVKEVYVLGKVPGLYSSSGDISALIAHEPGKRESRVKGLIITVNEGPGDVRSHTSYLDLDEIENLSAAIASMVRLAREREKTEDSYTEIVYRTKDDLSFGLYLGETGQEGFIAAGGMDEPTVTMEPKRLGEVKQILDYGFSLLKMK